MLHAQTRKKCGIFRNFVCIDDDVATNPRVQAEPEGNLTLRATVGLQQCHQQVAWMCNMVITERLRQRKVGSGQPLLIGPEPGGGLPHENWPHVARK